MPLKMDGIAIPIIGELYLDEHVIAYEFPVALGGDLVHWIVRQGTTPLLEISVDRQSRLIGGVTLKAIDQIHDWIDVVQTNAASVYIADNVLPLIDLSSVDKDGIYFTTEITVTVYASEDRVRIQFGDSRTVGRQLSSRRIVFGFDLNNDLHFIDLVALTPNEVAQIRRNLRNA